MVLSMSDESKTRNSGVAAGAEAPDGAFWHRAGTVINTAATAAADTNKKRQGETEKRNMRKLYQIGRPSDRSPPCLASDYNEKTDKIPAGENIRGATHLQHHQAGRGPQRFYRSHSGRDREGRISDCGDQEAGHLQGAGQGLLCRSYGQAVLRGAV